MSKQMLEMEAESVDAAIDIACAELGITRDQARIQILADGKKKIPGVLGPVQARVRMTVKSPEDEIEEAEAPVAAEPARAPERAPERREERAPRERAERPERPERTERPERQERAPRRQEERARPADEESDEHDEGRDEDVDDGRLDARAEGVDVGEEAAQILERLLDEMGMDGEVDIVDETDDGLTLEIEGQDGALLIGKHGQTLDALQYVVNRLVGKRYRNVKRITVDTESYRTRREESVRQMALEFAQRAIDTRRPVTMNPMSARARRIVHVALKDNRFVETRSIGHDDQRKIVISPKGSGRRDRGDDRPANGPGRGGEPRRGRRQRGRD
ncbi:MAG: KH domain-containing protein [Myxococcales bacterium]|nr:KH domain-containing protein [Myxococcales bacterium]